LKKWHFFLWTPYLRRVRGTRYRMRFEGMHRRRRSQSRWPSQKGRVIARSTMIMSRTSLIITPSKNSSIGALSWKCHRHVATCQGRHNVSLQFWPDGSVSPTQNLRCRGSLCRLEPTFPKFSEFVCRNTLWYGSTYAQIYSTHIIS
jgi:hypothetical protein